MPGIKKSTKPLSNTDKLNNLLKNQNAQADSLYKLLHKGTSIAHVKAYYEMNQRYNTYYREMRTRNLTELKAKLLDRKAKTLLKSVDILKAKGVDEFMKYTKAVAYIL